jgi:hypothetical protein
LPPLERPAAADSDLAERSIVRQVAPTEASMDKKQRTIRIELTEAQRKELREQTGQDVQVLELDLTEMEPRVAPTRIGTFF